MSRHPSMERQMQGLELIPEYMRDGMTRYIKRGIPPGSFLTAVLSNDLMGALRKADDTNINAMPAYGRFLYNYAPAGCYGSPDAVDRWVKKGGTEGIERRTREMSAELPQAEREVLELKGMI